MAILVRLSRLRLQTINCAEIITKLTLAFVIWWNHFHLRSWWSASEHPGLHNPALPRCIVFCSAQGGTRDLPMRSSRLQVQEFFFCPALKIILITHMVVVYGAAIQNDSPCSILGFIISNKVSKQSNSLARTFHKNGDDITIYVIHRLKSRSKFQSTLHFVPINSNTTTGS